jgi:Flp pilus assembly pilin Flp
VKADMHNVNDQKKAGSSSTVKPRGQALVDYTLLLLVIAVSVVLVARGLTGSLSNSVCKVDNSFQGDNVRFKDISSASLRERNWNPK